MPLEDWNVVATVRNRAYAEARQALEDFGPVAKTDYFNVLVLRVEDARAFADGLRAAWEANPRLREWLGRVVPLERMFRFQDAAQFEERAREAVRPWLEELVGTRFHVRMHRRGFRGRLSSQEEERFLDRFIQELLPGEGRAPEVDFQDPDRILDLETVGQRGGASLWTREDLHRYSFLHLD